MGRGDSGFRQAESQDMIPIWSQEVHLFTGAVVQQLGPCCVILYGSVATGRYTRASDVDIVVIAPALPSDWLERLRLVDRCNQTRAPIQALAYTPEEFNDMIDEGSVTALDAVTQGRPLHGQDYFSGLAARVQKLLDAGLIRTGTSWSFRASDTKGQ